MHREIMHRNISITFAARESYRHLCSGWGTWTLWRLATCHGKKINRCICRTLSLSSKIFVEPLDIILFHVPKMQFPGFEVFLSSCLPLKRGYNLCNQYTWNEYWRWEVHEIVDALKNLREGRDTRGNKSALENFQNSDWPWVLHRWSWLWTAFASTRTGLGKQKDWAWSVIWEKGSNRGLTGPFLLYYYWPGSIFEFNESSSSKWFFSAFLLFWLVKKEHT